MKKVKVFFAVAAIMLASAGVLSAKAKFATASVPNLYYYDGVSSYVEIGSGTFAASPLVYYTSGSGTAANQAYIIIPPVSSTTKYFLYTSPAGTQQGVY